MRTEDRAIVAMMATQVYAARISSGQVHPDPVSVAGEAVSLLDKVDRHLAPKERKREKAIEITPRGTTQ